jgi:dTDP-4-dehydrorhamnose 3,5-epimerase
VRIHAASLDGVHVIEPDRFDDERGWFMELWNQERYKRAGLDVTFVQANVSHSRKGVLRGMHYQAPNEQGKLVSVLEGGVFDVVVDIRRDSASFGRWYGCELSRENGRQLWVPEGFAHGFLVLTDTATVHYNCTAVYDRASDRCLAWDDPDIGIRWPHAPSTVSAKDRAAPRLGEIAPGDLPQTVK